MRFNRNFVISICAYLISAFSLLIYHEYYFFSLNTNTISIINIAQKYINGDFADAVNGAYGPLTSWLLIPFLKFGLNPVLSVRILDIIICILLLSGIRALSGRFEMTEKLKDIISFTAVPILLSYTFRGHSPDLLVACILVYYLNIIFDSGYPANKINGLLCGLMGAVGYLNKSYLFPFFISHFFLMNIVYYFRIQGEKKKVLINVALGFIIFIFISGIWIIQLSNKYGSVTFSTSGEYNMRQIGPSVLASKETSWTGWDGWRYYITSGNPVYSQGFFPPPNATALSVWEDFTYLTPYQEPWSPFESLDSFKYYIKHIMKNIYYTIGIFEGSFSLFASIILLGYILVYCVPLNLQILGNHGFLSLITIALYSGGYLLVHPDERYSLIVRILILMMGAHLISRIFQYEFFNKTRRNVLIAFFILSFIAMPMKSVISTSNFDKKNYEELSEQLRSIPDLGGRVASNDKFSETLKLIFYSKKNLKYFGQAKKGISTHDLKIELEKYDIDYYLLWIDDNDEIPEFLYQYKELTRGGFSRHNDGPVLMIYSLNT